MLRSGVLRVRLPYFERYLSLWVLLCMLVGLGLGKVVPAAVRAIRGFEFGEGSQINVPIAILIWLMITPMMMKVDFASIRGVGAKPAGLLVTLAVNWLVKPFLMALLTWFFPVLPSPLSFQKTRPTSTSPAASYWRRHRARRWCLCGAI